MSAQTQETFGPKVLSFALRKGGVCRTTMVFNISYAAAMRGLKVLMIDLDSQHNLTDISTKLPPEAVTIYDALADCAQLTAAVRPTSHPNLFLVPGDREMSHLDFALGEIPPEVRFQILNRWFQNSPGIKQFDLLTIDMGPAMSGAMINALAASTHFISPIRSDADSLDGLSQLFDEMAAEVYQENPNLKFLGAFLVDFDNRMLVPRSVEKTLRAKLGADAFKAVIRSNASFQKARAVKQSIFEFEQEHANSKLTRGRDDVLALTDEIIERLGLSKRFEIQTTRRVANE